MGSAGQGGAVVQHPARHRALARATARNVEQHQQCNKKARAGQFKNFTGVDDPYEAPLQPELTVDATGTSPQEPTVLIMQYLEEKELVRS